MVDDFFRRPAAKRDYWRPARHRLDHDHAERFEPVDWKQQHNSIAEEIRLLALVDLADVLDIWRRRDHRLDDLIPIGLVHPVDLGGDLQLGADAIGYHNGAVGTFL